MSAIKNILCPLDFSSDSEAALKNAVFLAKLYRAKLHILHVVTVMPESFSIIYGVRLNDVIDREEVTKNVNQLLDELIERNTDASVEVRKHVRHGRIYTEVVEEAKAVEADLILMSTSGEEGVEGTLVGSNAYKTILSAPCPIITYREQAVTKGFRKILVPVNPKFGIREIRRYLRGYFHNMASEVHLLRIFEDEPSDQEMKNSSYYMEKELEYFAKEGGGFEVSYDMVQHEHVADGILEYARDKEYDLIVLNTHGRRGLGKLVMGSVTSAVVSKANCAVMTVRPGRGEVSNFTYHSWFPV